MKEIVFTIDNLQNIEKRMGKKTEITYYLNIEIIKFWLLLCFTSIM